MWVGMIIVPCWHAFIVAVLIYVIICLQILNVKLSKMKEVQLDKCGGLKKNYSMKYNQELIECIETRQKIFDFANEISSLNSLSLFLDVVLFSILICALLFQASISALGVELYIIFCYILTMITILWMYYWHSNEITYYVSELFIVLSSFILD